MQKTKKSDIEEVFSDDAPPADAPEPKWETREKRPSTVEVRPAVPGEKVGDHVCSKGEYVVKGREEGTQVVTREFLDAAYYPPVVETTPDVSGRWKIEITDSALVPFEFKTTNGIPDRRKIAETLEAVRTERLQAEEWNKANPNQRKRVPSYPTIPGVYPSEVVVVG